jgi:hypothetical protein
MKKILVLIAVITALFIIPGSVKNAHGMVADSHGKTTVSHFDFCACGGGGLPYCDAAEVGTVLYARWIVWFSLPPNGYSYQTNNFKCEYNSAAAVARSWTIQVGLDPNSGPGRFWLLA